MLSRVIAKNVGDVFLRHSVHSAACVFEIAEPIKMKLVTVDNVYAEPCHNSPVSPPRTFLLTSVRVRR